MKFIDYVEKLKLEARKQNIRIVRDEVDKPWVKTKINTFITAWDGMWTAEEVNAAYKAIKEAEKHYCELRDQFVKDYGSFHMTFTDTGSFFFDPFRFTIL